MTGPPTQCVYCVHYRSPLDDPDREGDAQLCDAFPDGDGIPEQIWGGRADHREAYKGDHGVRWEPRAEGVEFPEDALADAQG